MRNVATSGANRDTAYAVPLDDPSPYHDDRVAVSTVFGQSTTQWASIGDFSVVYATVQNPNRSIRYLWNCSGA